MRPLKPGVLWNSCTEHTKTHSTEIIHHSGQVPAEQKKQAMKEAAEAESGKNRKYGKIRLGQGVLYYSYRHGEKVFDITGREKKMVYF